MKFTSGDIHIHRDAIKSFVKEKRSLGKFSVIDVGGDAGNHSGDFADFIIDINSRDSNVSFKVDICDECDWKKVLDYVASKGKFDYCICSHTLEDVYNPYLSFRMFPLIASSGTIMVPHHSTELSNVESSHYLGYIHHRYLYKEKEGKILVCPKMPFIEKIDINHEVPYLINLKIDWEESIDYDFFMNNYFGPTTDSIINNFTKEFSKQ